MFTIFARQMAIQCLRICNVGQDTRKMPFSRRTYACVKCIQLVGFFCLPGWLVVQYTIQEYCHLLSQKYYNCWETHHQKPAVPQTSGMACSLDYPQSFKKQRHFHKMYNKYRNMYVDKIPNLI